MDAARGARVRLAPPGGSQRGEGGGAKPSRESARERESREREARRQQLQRSLDEAQKPLAAALAVAWKGIVCGAAAPAGVQRAPALASVRQAAVRVCARMATVGGRWWRESVTGAMLLGLSAYVDAPHPAPPAQPLEALSLFLTALPRTPPRVKPPASPPPAHILQLNNSTCLRPLLPSLSAPPYPGCPCVCCVCPLRLHPTCSLCLHQATTWCWTPALPSLPPSSPASTPLSRPLRHAPIPALPLPSSHPLPLCSLLPLVHLAPRPAARHPHRPLLAALWRLHLSRSAPALRSHGTQASTGSTGCMGSKGSKGRDGGGGREGERGGVVARAAEWLWGATVRGMRVWEGKR
ncbi:unnamed protein product [Closterium sp. NIES-65]|nr:unnamed protein product [Closterium sp. NIES-65]